MNDVTIEKKIISTFEKAFTSMTNNQKENLLMYGEGMIAILESSKTSSDDKEEN